jgi:ribosomal protein S18 acetylase RimI-like enzyme
MIKVRHIIEKDFKEWRPLFEGYADFYKVKINDDIIDNVWSWLHDSKHVLKALVVEKNQQIVAFAHYRKMPSALRGKDIGFLDDLYVHLECRGQKLSELLIYELQKISKENNWNLVRWITRDDNERAKNVYDKIANKTNWDVYELL